MSSDLISCDGWASPVEGLGPGARTVLWVTGCDRACPGCISKELQAHTAGTDIGGVVEALLPLVRSTGRLTVSGGEPFDQAPVLCALVDALRREIEVELFVYTGYKLNELRSSPESCALLGRCDMIMDGPYDQAASDTLVWRGSDNQQLHLLSDRARAAYESMKMATWEPKRPLTFKRLDDFSIRLIGIPARADLDELRAAVDAAGYRLDG